MLNANSNSGDSMNTLHHAIVSLENRLASMEANQHSSDDIDDLRLEMEALRKTIAAITVGGDTGAGSVTGDGKVESEIIAGRDAVKAAIHAPNATININKPPAKAKSPAHTGPEQAYLRWLFQTTRRLALGGLDLNQADATQQAQVITLDAVYVALDVLPSASLKRGKKAAQTLPNARPGDEPPMPLLEAVQHNKRLVLLGDPGSGKSTFINYLTLCLAGARLEPDRDWLGRLRRNDHNARKFAWPKTAYVPVRVILRDFAASLPPDCECATADMLWSFIKEELVSHNLGDYAPALQENLRKGECVVMLDGLDEVPDVARRALVRDAVLAFADTYSRNRYTVTCRVLSYTSAAWKLTGFSVGRLARFNEDQIATFIGAWYDTLARQGQLVADVANARATELRSVVPGQRDLAQNPMLLTVMALLHTYSGKLPEERARLYDECVGLLLWRWQQTKYAPGGGKEPGIEKRLGTRTERLINALCELAWTAHQQRGLEKGASDVPEKEVLNVLKGYLSNDWGKAQAFCEYVEERAGLLVGRGIKQADAKNGEDEAVYAFPHRTFQEFLAGCYLAAQRDFSREALELVPKGDHWREVVLLAAGHLVFNQNRIVAPLDAANLLSSTELPTERESWRAVWWAGEIMAIVGSEAALSDPVGPRLLPRIRQQLVDLLEGGHLAPAQRARVGDVLGRLKDPRPGVETLEPALVDISGGTSKLGDGDQQHDVKLARFKVSRFTVTNAQFWQFIDADGYENPLYWTTAGWTWRQHAGDDVTGFASDALNRPVTGITWYEAMAFAAWLSALTGKTYRLPSEAEWVRVAAGTEGRQYPWGDDWQDGIANTSETGLGHPSAVGAFPRDVTPDGVYDLGGNTWEWTLSRHAEYPYDPDDGREDPEGDAERVLRGGACTNSKRLVRCIYRNWVAPDSRLPYIGFRLVSVEGPRALPAPTEEAKK